MTLTIAEIAAGAGRLAICPAPGSTGTYAADLATLRDWGPALVLSMTTSQELTEAGAATLPDDLKALGITWLHLPVPDFDTPPLQTERLWPATSAKARAILATGGKVLIHCRGGCGRSGMAALRLLIERGEPLDHALARLRAARPCAVETPAQLTWATTT